MMIKPINFKILNEEFVTRNINFRTFKFNYQSRLSSNCCLTPQCPFYLSTDIDVSKHMQNWKEQMPFGFHQFVLEQVEQGNDIKKIMQECKKKWHQFPEKYNQDDDVVEQYIKMISESI